jgi:hypothetical protein
MKCTHIAVCDTIIMVHINSEESMFMDYFLFELIVFIFSVFHSYKFFKSWFGVFRVRITGDNELTKWIFGCLPVFSFAIILNTLKGLASFDVVDNQFYIIFYIFLGYIYIYFGLKLMTIFFDLSWVYDILNLNNKAALFSVSGGFIALTIIYSGANIGNGPGWWCVVFAGGLGLAAWIILGLVVNIFTDVFECITIERDINCGVRTGLFFIASGIILGRASAGDWTSFSMTVVEFMDGWPVLLLTLLMIFIELFYFKKSVEQRGTNQDSLVSSIMWGAIYILIAVIIIMKLPPLPKNPLYYSALAETTQKGLYCGLFH